LDQWEESSKSGAREEVRGEQQDSTIAAFFFSSNLRLGGLFTHDGFFRFVQPLLEDMLGINTSFFLAIGDLKGRVVKGLNGLSQTGILYFSHHIVLPSLTVCRCRASAEPTSVVTLAATYVKEIRTMSYFVYTGRSCDAEGGHVDLMCLVAEKLFGAGLCGGAGGPDIVDQ
jgi:hypothetical protein